MNGHELIAQLPSSAHVTDSSKIGDFQSCERYFFFAHILGWRNEEPNIHLEFGHAAHLAKEYLRLNDGYEDEGALDAAIALFMEHYNLIYPDPEWESINKPKNKDGFVTAIAEHVRRFRDERAEWELLFTEVGFCVSIDHQGSLYYGRMDAIYWVPGFEDRRGKGILVVDDKFSGYDNDAMREKWYLSFQIRGYLNALLSHTGAENPIWQREEIWGALVDMLCIKSEVRLKNDGQPYANSRTLDYDPQGIPFRHRHLPVPIPIDEQALTVTSWLFEANYRSAAIRHNFELLESAKESDPVMHAFPRNDGACIRFGKVCKFFTLCHPAHNPLQIADNVPVDFKQEYWDPRVRKKQKIDITEIK